MISPLLARLRSELDAADVRFRALAPRERLLVSAMSIALVAYAVDSFALRPLEGERSRIATAIRTQNERLEALDRDLETTRHPVLDDSERARRDEIRQLETQIAQIDEGIRSAVSRLVPPESAVEVLEELLADDGRLELVQLTSEAPRRLGPEETSGASTLYHHGLRLEIQGDFAATLDYLRRLEASDWQLLWDRFEYRVESHPEARVTIEIHTLSEREEWVGV
jgi:MSHA biogenesis protein MshJ